MPDYQLKKKKQKDVKTIFNAFIEANIVILKERTEEGKCINKEMQQPFEYRKDGLVNRDVLCYHAKAPGLNRAR